MENRQKTPLTVGQVLDVTFSIIKENLAKLYLISLIFIGPYYLLLTIGSIVDGMPLLPEGASGSIQSLWQGFSQPATDSAYTEPAWLGFVLIGSLLLLLVIPVCYASIIILVERAGNKETVKIGSIIKQAFSRYWALLGAGIVFFLVVYGITIGIIGIIALLVAGSTVSMFSEPSFSSLGTGTIVTVTVLVLIAVASLTYLITRWSFFFSATVFEKVSPGLGKSWRLTRGHFWRLLGLYIVMSIIYIAILSVVSTVSNVFLSGSLLSLILNGLFSPLISAIPITAYAVTYFDLRVRNDAADLKQLLETYQEQENPNSSNFVTTGAANPLNTQSLGQQPGEFGQGSDGMS